MSRKLVICMASVLALLTLDLQAQNPFGSGDSAQPTAQSSTAQPRTLFPGPPRDIMRADMMRGPGPQMIGQSIASQPSREEMELANHSATLIKQLGKAEGESKEKIKVQLTETLGKQFDLRQKRHEAEIAALEAQVKKLKEIVQKRQDNRREIIGKRLDQLVREADGLGW